MLGVLRRLWRGDSIPPAPVTPARFEVARLPEVDAVEETPSDARALPVEEVADLAGRGFVIVYVDAAGEDSERRIICHQVYKADSFVYLRARCLEREASRTFRVDRIEEVYCGVTGEALGQPSRLFLATETRADRPRPPVRKAMSVEERRVRTALRILATVSRCDGSIHTGERSVIHDFVRREAPADKSEEQVDAMFDWAMGLQPNLGLLIEDLGDLARADAALAVRTLQAVVEIIMADGHVNAQEQELLNDLAWLSDQLGLPVRFETFTT